jgi:hypothetical protein
MSFEDFCKIHNCTETERLELFCHLMVFRNFKNYVHVMHIKERVL